MIFIKWKKKKMSKKKNKKSELKRQLEELQRQLVYALKTIALALWARHGGVWIKTSLEACERLLMLRLRVPVSR